MLSEKLNCIAIDVLMVPLQSTYLPDFPSNSRVSPPLIGSYVVALVIAGLSGHVEFNEIPVYFSHGGINFVPSSSLTRATAPLLEHVRFLARI